MKKEFTSLFYRMSVTRDRAEVWRDIVFLWAAAINNRVHYKQKVEDEMCIRDRMEDYRRRTKSSASDTEIMGYLKPFLICRPDGKALGMQRVYKKDGESKGRKIYVLCIRKKDFLKR